MSIVEQLYAATSVRAIIREQGPMWWVNQWIVPWNSQNSSNTLGGIIDPLQYSPQVEEFLHFIGQSSVRSLRSSAKFSELARKLPSYYAVPCVYVCVCACALYGNFDIHSRRDRTAGRNFTQATIRKWNGKRANEANEMDSYHQQFYVCKHSTASDEKFDGTL